MCRSRIIRLKPLAAAALVALASSGCSDEVVDAATLALRYDEPFAARDSAGIRILESSETLWGEGEGWRIDPEPALVVGTIAGSDEYLFESVRSVRLLPDGGVIFGEAGDGTVRRFGPDGEIVWMEGGEGEGPGEFRCLAGLVMEEESVLAWQCSPVGAPVRYGLDGKVLKILHTRTGTSGSVVGSYSNGDLLMLDYRDSEPTEVSDRIVRVDRAFKRAREDASADTLMVLPYQHEMVIPVVGESEGMLLGPENIRTLYRDTLYTGFNERYEVRVYDGEGVLHRIVRRAYEPEPLDMDRINGLLDELIEEELEEIEDPAGRRAMRVLFAGVRRLLVFPDYMPAYSQIRVAKDGHLWVRVDTDQLIDISQLDTPDTPGHWDVFDPEGRWLGEVVTPASFEIHEIGDDYVLGVITNEVDVQFVVKYPLLKDPDANG